jgi:hypothetical protein
MTAKPRLTVNDNFGLCPICKGDPKTCKHSLQEMNERVWQDFIRAIVRDELSKARKNGEG